MPLLGKPPILKRTSSEYKALVLRHAITLTSSTSVPLLIRGPGVPKGHINHVVSSHTDLAPTFLALAKGDAHIRDWVDGGVIPVIPQLRNHPKPVSKESFVVEFWSNGFMQ